MHRPTKKLLGLIAAAALAACSLGSTGCTAETKEKTGSRTEMLLAPEAVLTTNASALTKSELGIAKWKVFRGKSDYVLTGYDARGKAVKGVSIAWEQGSSKTKSSPVLKGRVLDGSRFAARHTYDGSKSTQSNKSISKSTKAFLLRATFDMGAAGAAIWGKSHDGKSPPQGYFGEGFPTGGATTPPATPGTPGAPTLPFPTDDPFGGLGYPGDDPLGGMNPGGCGMDMTSMLMSALQCLMGGGIGGGAGGAGGANIMQCIQAASAGAGIGGSCTDPMGGMDGPMGPGGMGGPMGPGGMGDPYGDMGGPGDPYGGGAADQAGGPMACMSCPEGGGYGDIGMDPMSGDVYGGEGGYGGPGGDMGFGAGW